MFSTFDAELHKNNLELFDEMGKLILRDDFRGNVYSFSTENFAAGIYVIRITGNDTPFNRKIFVR
jgi:hypothetical protein